MDDALDMDYLKRGPIQTTWDENPMFPAEPNVSVESETTLFVVTSQITSSHSRGPETGSIYDGSFETSSVILASSAPTSESIPTTFVPSSSTEIPESTPATATSTFPSIPTGTRMSLFALVSSTSANTFETAAPGAYSGGGDSVKNKLAIALPIAIVGLFLILALIFFLLRRQRRRTTRPPYEMTGNARGGLSSAALMNSPKIVIAPPIPAPAHPPRIPIIDVTSTHDSHHQHQPTPGSASARSDDGSRTELGVAVAVPMDQRLSATEHDLREFSRPVSSADHRVSAGPPSAGLASVRMPFENPSSDENDTVSILSGEHGREDVEHDFDDMSSVSSFNDEHPEMVRHDRSF